MNQLRNRAAAIAALLLLASCSDDGAQPREPGPGASPEADYEVLGGMHRGGPGRWAVTAFGDPEAPMAVLEVPVGFQGRESYVWTDRQGPDAFAQLAYWSPTRVPRDPCRPDGPSAPIGSTVQDLATALAAQTRTTTTEPVPVALDGHEGLYVELTSPTRVDYAECGPESAMLIWETGPGGDGRALDGPTTDRYWILDVEDRRVVLSALTTRAAAPDTVELVTGVATSATFVEQG